MKKQIITAAVALGIMAANANQAGAHELTYKIQSGDSLWRISFDNQISVQDLMRYNNLSSSTIYAGQELTLLPPHSHETEQQTPTYIVESGDSLSLIAKNHSTTVSELKTINNLTSDLIKIGQVLKLPAGTQAQPKPAPSPATTETYTVMSGDSLSLIAKNHNTTVSELKTINKLTSDFIKIGQVLKLPAGTQAQPKPAPDVKPAFNADALIEEAKKYIGVPYVWGGATPSGFDCSGFLNYVFNTQGITLPRTVANIWSATVPVSGPRKGDLVFFTTYAPGASHAGIYIGDNKFLHAGSSTGITISDLNNSYWSPRYLDAKSVR